jgi:hypothetical protein
MGYVQYENNILPLTRHAITPAYKLLNLEKRHPNSMDKLEKNTNKR